MTPSQGEKDQMSVARIRRELWRGWGGEAAHGTPSHLNGSAACSPQLFVRALFDYDPGQDPAVPCKDAAVAFRWGDVLQIVSAEDDAWWQACHQGDGQARAGLVPSAQLQQRSATFDLRACGADYSPLLPFFEQEGGAAAPQSTLQSWQGQSAR